MKVLNACPFNLSDDKIRILWEITPQCNMKCKHCLFFQNMDKSYKNELTTKQIYKIIDNISKDKEVDAIWLSGGEPLLRKDIVDICEKISSYGIKPSISTNGVLLNGDLIEKLYKAGVNYIHLSIDGAKANTHDNLRGVPGAFNKLLKVMNLLKNSPIKTGASFMVTEESINEIEQVVKIAQDNNLSVLSFYLVAQLGRGAINFQEDKSNLAYKLNEKIKIIEKLNNTNLKIEMFRADKGEKSQNCVLQECKADRFLNITYDGKLGACPWLMKSNEGFTVGSLLEENFIQLKKDCQLKVKQKIQERREKLQYCENCEQNDRCGRGCMALQINKEGLYYALDPICPSINKKMEKSLSVSR